MESDHPVRDIVASRLDHPVRDSVASRPSWKRRGVLAFPSREEGAGEEGGAVWLSVGQPRMSGRSRLDRDRDRAAQAHIG